MRPANTFFKIINNEHLVSLIIDFKGRTRKEQQQRYIALYVWAYNILLDNPAPKGQHLIQAARRANLFDVNLKKYLGEVTDSYFVSSTEGYSLNTPGSREVDNIIRQISDDAVPEGYVYWKTSSKPAQKRQRLNREEQTVVDQWASLDLNIGNLDVRQLGKTTNVVMFTLWAITKGINVVPAVKPIMAFTYLAKKYPTVSVTANTFSRAFTRKYNEKYFQKNSNGLYFLSTVAERLVESWLKGEEIQSPSEPDAVDESDGEDS